MSSRFWALGRTVSIYANEKQRTKKNGGFSTHMDQCNVKKQTFTHLSSVCVGLLLPISV